jgi:transposase InsO family protein
LVEEGLSIRRACELVALSRSSRVYVRRPARHESLRAALKALWRPSMGYRMAWGTVRRQAAHASANVKLVHRLWRELQLSVAVRRRKKIQTGREVLPKAVGPGDVWCLDFLHETALNGQTIRILAVKDEFTRECLALEGATSFKASDVAIVLQAAFRRSGRPNRLRSDNGPEFIAGSLGEFLATEQTESLRIKPGSPWENGFIESFNARLRAELLDAQVFHNLPDAQMHLRVYLRYYNDERPHSALAYQTPREFRARYSESIRATPSPTPNIADLEKVGT